MLLLNINIQNGQDGSNILVICNGLIFELIMYGGVEIAVIGTVREGNCSTSQSQRENCVNYGCQLLFVFLKLYR